MLQLSLAVVLGAAGVAAQVSSADNLDPYSLNTWGNNSLYLRWRPQYHVTPASGHMNDPCGPMYDPTTKLYHLFYQSFPQHVNFGNTSWSHCTSSDLVDWTDVSDWRNRSMVAIATGPYPDNDWIGAFSGGAQPVNLYGEQDGNLTLMYSGASKWPDNWQVPYQKYTEQQNIATSSDGGVTWQKWSGNPVIKEPPGDWNVTGFRDPIFYPDPYLDKILQVSEPHYYLVAGSGIRGVGPRIPLYTAKATDLTKWTFLGALFEVATNVTFGGDVTRTGNFNYNFELAGFYSLLETKEHGGDGKTRHWVLNMGSEGYENRYHPLGHYTLYAFGEVSRRSNGSAFLDVKASGVLDWGNMYAANSFDDTKNGRRIIWGWSDEELNNTALLQQGFQGSMGIPRETFIKVRQNVIPIAGENILQAPDIWTANPGGVTYTVTSIAQRPAPDIVSALQTNASTDFGTIEASNSIEQLHSIPSSRYHLQLNIPLVTEGQETGIILRASPDLQEHTNITYYASNSSIVLQRSHSSLIPTVTKTTYVGFFQPFKQSQYASRIANISNEVISIDIYVDGSLLEIFLNERFALTARIYPSRADSTGVSLFSYGGGKTVFEDVKIWEDLKSVWPNRPANASSPLVFDPYYETHVLFNTSDAAYGTELYAGFRK